MPKTKQEKEQILQEATDNIAQAKSLVFAGYHGLSVADLTTLRAKLRAESVKFQVIKKTLLARAFTANNLDVDARKLGEGLAVAYGMQDEVAPAKVLAEFQKEHEVLAIYGGMLERKLISSERVLALAKLPSRDELYAKLVGSINAPVSGLVNTLAGTVRSFINVLNAISTAQS